MKIKIKKWHRCTFWGNYFEVFPSMIKVMFPWMQTVQQIRGRISKTKASLGHMIVTLRRPKRKHPQISEKLTTPTTIREHFFQREKVFCVVSCSKPTGNEHFFGVLFSFFLSILDPWDLVLSIISHLDLFPSKYRQI